ncbi:MAG: arsenite methyltransferase [Candidatus Hermodarchaeota archaeon]
MQKSEVKKLVRERYGKIAEKSSSCCPTPSSQYSCGCNNPYDAQSISLGYTKEEIELTPEGSNLGLGCGNPTASAHLKEGETVLDLGSGAGFDCFLAANKVGKTGKVIGVDMTPSMIDKARENALKDDYENVEFRLGEIENLPVADNIIDVIISNCVINLSTEKSRVYQEAFRVLKPGGRIIVSDIVLPKELPDIIKRDSTAYTGCIAGAMLKEKYIQTIKEAGFKDLLILEERPFEITVMHDGTTSNHIVSSTKIQAFKPI